MIALRLCQYVSLLCFSCLIISCSSSQQFVKTNSLRQKVVDFAKQQIGDKYQYGSKGPNSFDCSGLVHYSYRHSGIDINGSSSLLSKLGPGIQLKKAQPGDLIFYRKGGKVFHVSIISAVTARRLWVIHSTSSRGVIEEDILSSPYWKPMIHKIISLESTKR